MAAHAAPLLIRHAQKLFDRPASLSLQGPLYFVSRLDRVWLGLQCPRHAWGWPRANKEERTPGFDSHQTCTRCTSRRLFDSSAWRPGPVYRLRKRS